MKRFAGIGAAVMIGAAWAGAAPADPAGKSADDRPNVLLFLVDDMGWMDSTVYGSQYYETPHFERLAARGMTFWNAYSANPLCSPSRASLLTGQYPARHGITTAAGHLPPDPPGAPRYQEKAGPSVKTIQPRSERFLDPAAVTLAEVLRDAGYRTGHLGKWHLGLRPEHWPEAQGFEIAFHGAPDPGPPSYFSPYGYKAGTVTDGPPGEYITDRLGEEAVKFIEAHAGERWFLNLWQCGVHGPWGHQEAYTRAFAGKTDPRGAQGNPIMASMIKSVDDCLGRVLDTLDRLNLTGRTLVILTSDNGGNVHSNTPEDIDLGQIKPGDRRRPMIESWRKWAGNAPPTNNAPLRAGKGTLYEGGVRVPLIVSWPGRVAPGSDSLAVVSHIDVFPTVLAATGLSAPAGQPVDGLSLLPVLTGKAETLPREALFNYFPHGGPAKPAGVTVRRGDWKLIRWFETGPDYPETHELYHLRDDQGESTNVARWHPEEVAALDGLIDRFLAGTHAAAPKPNPAYRAPKSDPLLGWIVKSASAVPGERGLQVVPEPGHRSLLATTRLGALRHAGPLRLEIDLLSPEGVRGGIQWRTADQETFPATGQRQAFTLEPAPETTATAALDIPDGKRLAHLRLTLAKAAIIREIRLYPAQEKSDPVLRWRFAAPRPE